MPPAAQFYRSILPSAAAWAAVTAILLLIWARPSTARLDEDELYWVGSAYYAHLAFGRFDWHHPDWQLLPARENPPVAKYVIGAGLAATGHSVTTLDLLGKFYLLFEKLPGAWGTGAEYAKRDAVVRRMTPAVREAFRQTHQLNEPSAAFIAARSTMILCAVFTSGGLWLLGRWGMSAATGLVAAGLFLSHPAVVYAYNHAVSDAVPLLFSTLAGAALFALATRERRFEARVPRLRISAIAGLAIGLACAAKMNSLILFGVAAVVVARNASASWRNAGALLQDALSGVVLLCCAFVVFVACNPTIIGSPSDGLVAVVGEHRLTQQIQAHFLPDYLTSFSQKVAAVGTLTCGSTFLLVLVTVGAIGSLFASRPLLSFASLWFLLALVAVVVWIPLPRGRYVLPVVLPGALLLANWAGWMIEWAAKGSFRLRPAANSV